MGNVRLQHVSKIFDTSNIVVNDVNLEISDKEFIVLVGPSGCGKSTTLRMIAGLEEITSGNIYIDDRIVNHVAPKDRDIAMVFQNYALYPHMTVYDNLAFGLKMRKYGKEEIHARVTKAAEILGLTDLMKRKPKALSGGQRQRVALGRAIVRQPKVFLFDEPLSNLDANLRVQMRTELSRLHKQLKTTMIYVTHDQVEAMSMGDRIVVMKDGIVQQVDTPLTIYHAPANKFVAGFIGSPTMNFFAGRLIQGESLRFQAMGMKLELSIPKNFHHRLESRCGNEIIAGLRPEHIGVHPHPSGAEPITAYIEVTEPVGNEVFLYFLLDSSSTQFVARISSDKRPEPGTKLPLYFDTTKLHFFDPVTGDAL